MVRIIRSIEYTQLHEGFKPISSLNVVGEDWLIDLNDVYITRTIQEVILAYYLISLCLYTAPYYILNRRNVLLLLILFPFISVIAKRSLYAKDGSTSDYFPHCLPTIQNSVCFHCEHITSN